MEHFTSLAILTECAQLLTRCVFLYFILCIISTLEPHILDRKLFKGYGFLHQKQLLLEWINAFY